MEGNVGSILSPRFIAEQVQWVYAEHICVSYYEAIRGCFAAPDTLWVMTCALPDGFHCVCCGLDSLSVPSVEFLDRDFSCVDDWVITCRHCMDSGQAALDAIGVALIACHDVPHH